MEKPLDIYETNAAITMALEMVHCNMVRLTSENKPFPPFKEEIENVSLHAMALIYRRIESENKRLYMAHELDGEHMVITYKPLNGCMIWIESEPLEKVEPKFNCN